MQNQNFSLLGNEGHQSPPLRPLHDILPLNSGRSSFFLFFGWLFLPQRTYFIFSNWEFFWLVIWIIEMILYILIFTRFSQQSFFHDYFCIFPITYKAYITSLSFSSMTAPNPSEAPLNERLLFLSVCMGIPFFSQMCKQCMPLSYFFPLQ